VAHAAALLGLFAVAAPSLARAQGGDDAAQAAETGVLQVSAPVDGAVVYIDNKEVGTAPVTQYVPPGPHMIRVSADGYDPYVRKVEVRAGARARVTASLLRGGGTVEFQSTAPGATVLIDDKGSSAVPVRLKDLEPGDHTWRVTAPGHEPKEGSFTLRENGNVFVMAELISSRGLFVVTTEPAGARVTLDGEDKGVTPLSLEGVAPGEHVVDLSLDGYARSIQVVDTSDGAKGEVRTTLSSKGAKAIIKTGSADATVKISGVVVGTGKKVTVPMLARGRYPVEVDKPGAKTATGRLKVEDRGRSAYKATWADEGDRGRSKVVALPPFYENWIFWTAVGVGTGGAITGGVLIHQGTQPIPIPEGDVTVTLP
jgi:hypothetical protein